MKLKAAVALCSLIMSLTLSAQDSALNPKAPKIGAFAPELSFTRLMQAPAGSKTDWPSLRGKVVVLEFWATWCAPCIAEIPVLNALAASVDPAKVQFISVDDEDPAVVASFLKKRPISGWIGIDTTGKLYERFGVNVRPTTIIVGPDGRVVSTTVRPEQLKREQLLALAAGKPVKLGGDADPKVQAQLDAALAQAVAAQNSKVTDSINALFEISLTPGEEAKDGKQLDTHIMIRGPGKFDITNAPIDTLLSQGAKVPATRITGNFPDSTYNLHVQATGADPRQLAAAVELAISSGTHIRIEHHTEVKEVYVLTAKPDAAGNFKQTSHEGFAFYGTKNQSLQCINATADQLAGALEQAAGIPVVNETGLTGNLSLTLTIAPKDLASANAALASSGLALVAAQRPVETLILSAAPSTAKDAAH